MKITRLLSLTLLVFAMVSCSGDDNGNDNVNPGTQYPMSAKINNTSYNMANPSGSDYATDTFYTDDYPNEEYIRLQGKPIGDFLMREISIWIKRSDLHVGTINITRDDNWNDTYIKLIDNTISNYTVTNEGQVHITEINTTNKTVKGTFEFTTIDSDTDEIIHHITDGKFNYRYDTGEN